MATIPRIQKQPEPPQPSPVRTYTLGEMMMFGWLRGSPSWRVRKRPLRRANRFKSVRKSDRGRRF